MQNTFYFEFNKHEYYALLAVRKSEESEPFLYYSQRALQMYVDIVAGESVKEVIREGYPIELTKEEAFYKFARTNDAKGRTVESLIEDFESVAVGVLLVDNTFL